MTLRRLLGRLLAGLLIGSLIWLPARTLGPLMPNGVQCEAWHGRVWDGRCANLRIQTASFGEIQWDLRTASPLGLRPELALRWAQADSTVEARATLAGTRHIEFRELRADLAFATLRESLPAALLSQVTLPRAGRLRSSDLGFSLRRTEGGAWLPSRVVGFAQVSGLVYSAGPAAAEPIVLGDYEVAFGAQSAGADPTVAPQGASQDIVARVRDLGGPLLLQGRLRWQPAEARYRLDAQVQARNSSVRVLLDPLGPAAPDGSRELSLEGNY
ncbi:MAG: type II secretion system protein N [Sinobacteraceae bacterium]|nr:type II secretion system protein N [Nevskiaceae bacterium]